MLKIGDILEERYEIRSVLGKGGYGTVYEVYHRNLQRPCAIKELLHRGDPDFLNGFEQEARLLAGLNHPALPKVTDSFIEGDGFYFVMEYVPGEDLGAYILRQQNSMIEDEADALRLIAPVLDALEYLHSHLPSIIHRDIKPANIRVTLAGAVYLVDFGIAKLYDPSSRTSTSARAVTPGYSPLEQYQGGGTTDPSSDIYALGATLYYMLTGVVPPDAVQRIRLDSLVPITKLNHNTSLNLAAVISRMMALYQDHRIQDIPSLRQALAGKQPLQPTQDATMIDRAKLQTLHNEISAEIQSRQNRRDRTIIDNLALTALEASLERLGVIKSILAHDTYDLVFIGKIATGKTTAICHLFNLIYETKTTRKAGKKELPISIYRELLSTGSGNTTICEVVLRSAAQTEIEIEPHSEEAVRQLIDEFSTRIWNKAYPGNAGDERNAEPFPPEYDKAVRNMVNLRQRKEGDGSSALIDDALLLAQQFGSDQEQLFRETLLAQANMGERNERQVKYDGDPNDVESERAWVRKTFEAVNLVRQPNLSIPRCIYVALSANLLDHSLFPRLGAVIDTRGLGSSLQRPDLEVYIRRRSNALCIFTDLFPQAPTNVAELMKQFLTAEAQDLASKSMLMVLPKKGEPEKIMGVDGPVDDRDKGVELRRSYIEAEFAGSRINLDLTNILFYDALQFYKPDQSRDGDYGQEDIDAARRDMFQELEATINKRELALWNEALALEERVTAIRSGTSLNPHDEELIAQLKDELVGYTNQSFYAEDFTQRYIRFWLPTYASTLRAVNSRRGRYEPRDIDIYFAADLVAEQLVRDITQRLKNEIKDVIARLDTQSEPGSDLKPIARAFQDRIDAYFEEFIEATGTKLQEFIEKRALGQEEFWGPVQNRWGKGPHYKDDVVSMYRDQLDEEHVVDKLRKIADHQWKQSFLRRIRSFFG